MNSMENSNLMNQPNLRQVKLPENESVSSVFGPLRRGWVR